MDLYLSLFISVCEISSILSLLVSLQPSPSSKWMANRSAAFSLLLKSFKRVAYYGLNYGCICDRRKKRLLCSCKSPA